MLDICLKLLAILGIFLLVLFGVLLIGLFLILFYPVTYRIRGKKDTERLELSVKVKWLSGLVRVQYQFPEPGRVKLKLLCFTLYNKKIPSDKPISSREEDKPGEAEPDTAKADRTAAQSKEESKSDDTKKAPEASGTAESPGRQEEAGVEEKADTTEGCLKTEEEKRIGTVELSGGSEKESEKKSRKFFEKIKKIRYTIQSIYDKMKKIWENISYYTEILQEEETKELFAHALHVTGKVFKSICPRRVKADILLGTGSPNTTGYIYGIYCMLTASLKPGFLVTPDFERKIFQGEFEVEGHVVTGVLLVNGLKLLLDKKLHNFIRKIKKKTKTK